MSTVLWENILKDGKVESDGADKYALFKFTGKLDKICKQIRIRIFSSLLDHTDFKFNLSNDYLPAGIQSTDEWMALDGNWADGKVALENLKTLKEAIIAENIKFGLFSDHRNAILEELDDALKIAEKAAAQNAKFNFSVVM